MSDNQQDSLFSNGGQGEDTSTPDSGQDTLFSNARDPEQETQEEPEDDAEAEVDDGVEAPSSPEARAEDDAEGAAESEGNKQVDFDGFEIDSEVAIEADDWNKEESPLVWLFSKSARVNLVAFAAKQALEDNPAYINKSALAREAGVSRHSASRYLEDLVDLGIFRTRGYGYDRYCANPDSRVLQAVVILQRELYTCA